MRVFEHPNTPGDWCCPICHTADDKPVVLVKIISTEDGRNVEAAQFHVDCLDLWWSKEQCAVYMSVPEVVQEKSTSFSCKKPQNRGENKCTN